MPLTKDQLRELAVPSVHLNGTSREGLVEPLERTEYAIREAIDQLMRATPHGRDYYVQEGDVLDKATKQHQARMTKLQEVLEELEYIDLKIRYGDD